MDRGLHILVVVAGSDSESDLEVRWNEGDNVVNFYLDGKLVFSGDWDGNFKQLFKCLLKEVK